MTKKSTEKVAEIFLDQGTHQLKRDELAEAEASHRQALETVNTAAIQSQVQRAWEDRIRHYFEKKDWPCAGTALASLQALRAANEKALVALRDELFERKAQDELDREHLDAALDCLANLSAEARPRFKSLFRTYLRGKAGQGNWVGGYAALKRLVDRMPGDEEAIAWRANWLLSWAQVLFSAEKRHRQPLQAKRLCLKILDPAVAPLETPLIDLLANDASPAHKDAPLLRQCACALLAKILAELVHTCLSEGHLDQAESHFQAALGLPFPPERRLLFDLAKDQLCFSLEVGRPDQAFTLLNALKTASEDGEREEIRKTVRQFGRLYAGRNSWDEAQQALTRLHEWLAPHAQEEVAGLLDALNRERLDLASARRKLTNRPGAEEIERRKEECEAAKAGYQAAQSLALDTQAGWAEDYIQACFALGEAYLADADPDQALDHAVLTYENILKEDSHRPEHESRISQGLHGYCARMLEQSNWDEARQTADRLKNLALAAPDDRTRPDPRVAGAIQQVILRQSEAHLDMDRIQETFAQFEQLRNWPDPWPVGEIKAMIQTYKPEPGDELEWTLACEAARALNALLNDATEPAHDQETLQWLVNRLVDYAASLEHRTKIAEAADICKEALERSRATTRPRSAKIANAYIQMTRRLAQDRLQEDLRSRPAALAKAIARDQSTDERQTEKISGALQEATQRLQNILEVPEHKASHERLVNQALHDHAWSLAKLAEWERARQALARLDDLYRETPRYRSQFAGWRRDVDLDEVQMALSKEQLDAAFKRLEELKGWLERYGASEASWLQNANEVKTACKDAYEKWLKKGKWDLAVPLAQHLVSLLPADEEANGWLVQALYRQGQELHSHQRWEEALTRFKEALEIAPKQTALPEADIPRAALKTRLEQAGQQLEEGNLAGAVAVYAQALQLAGDHPQRAAAIRQALTQYGDSLIAPGTPPDWSTAYQIPDHLKKLGLYDNQGLEWHQHLILEHMQAILWDTDKVDAAFAKLADLPAPWPVTKLQEMVAGYSKDQVKTEEHGDAAIQALERLGKELLDDAPARATVIKKLNTLGERLLALGNADGQIEALEAAGRLEPQKPA